MVWLGSVRARETPRVASGHLPVRGELEPVRERQGEFKWMRGLGLCSVNKYLAEVTCGLGTCGHPGDADTRHLTSMFGALSACQTQF